MSNQRYMPEESHRVSLRSTLEFALTLGKFSGAASILAGEER